MKYYYDDFGNKISKWERVALLARSLKFLTYDINRLNTMPFIDGGLLLSKIQKMYLKDEHEHELKSIVNGN